MYIKPILDFLSYLINLFIKFITYPIELLINIPFFQLNNCTTTLILSIHLTWFVHYYIYFFIAFYFIYHFVKYYYYATNSSWIYETMAETIMLSQHNRFMYWHTMDKIWSNYKTPEQILTFKLHTFVLLNMSTQYHMNYIAVNKRNYEPLVNIFI